MCQSPPLLGFQTPPFSVFSIFLKNYSLDKKYVEIKVVGLKKLISGNFYFRTISLQTTNLSFFKTLICSENEGTRITYSKGELVGSHGITIFLMMQILKKWLFHDSLHQYLVSIDADNTN